MWQKCLPIYESMKLASNLPWVTNSKQLPYASCEDSGPNISKTQNTSYEHTDPFQGRKLSGFLEKAAHTYIEVIRRSSAGDASRNSLSTDTASTSVVSSSLVALVYSLSPWRTTPTYL